MFVSLPSVNMCGWSRHIDGGSPALESELVCGVWRAYGAGGIGAVSRLRENSASGDNC